MKAWALNDCLVLLIMCILWHLEPAFVCPKLGNIKVGKFYNPAIFSGTLDLARSEYFI